MAGTISYAENGNTAADAETPCAGPGIVPTIFTSTKMSEGPVMSEMMGKSGLSCVVYNLPNGQCESVGKSDISG